VAPVLVEVELCGAPTTSAAISKRPRHNTILPTVSEKRKL
jgi:hypothetical protein